MGAGFEDLRAVAPGLWLRFKQDSMDLQSLDCWKRLGGGHQKKKVQSQLLGLAPGGEGVRHYLRRSSLPEVRYGVPPRDGLAMNL